jgi:hypothetical protein
MYNQHHHHHHPASSRASQTKTSFEVSASNTCTRGPHGAEIRRRWPVGVVDNEWKWNLPYTIIYHIVIIYIIIIRIRIIIIYNYIILYIYTPMFGNIGDNDAHEIWEYPVPKRLHMAVDRFTIYRWRSYWKFGEGIEIPYLSWVIIYRWKFVHGHFWIWWSPSKIWISCDPNHV